MKQIVLKFGLLAVALMLILKLSEYSLTTHIFKQEIVISLVALIFIVFGIMLSKLIFKPKQKLAEIDASKIKSLGISNRELDVLKKMASGKSNHEIANELFISENTVKTHVSKILSKLDAKRRTEAIVKAKELSIIH